MTARVGDVMTRKVVAVHKHAQYKDIIAVMRRRHVSALPVVDDHDRVLGIVSEGDLLLKEAYADRPSGSPQLLLRRPERAKAAALTAAGLMTSPAVTVTPAAAAATAAQVMLGEKVKRLPVVDDTGRLVGIVSRADVLGRAVVPWLATRLRAGGPAGRCPSPARPCRCGVFRCRV
jgi:CBS domain-containing protein